MSELASYLLIVSFCLAGLIVILYLVMVARLLSYLETRHPAFYTKMGAPSLFLRNSISNSTSVVRFLIHRGYVETSDPEAKRLGERARALLLASTGICALMFVFFIVTSATF